MGISVEAIGTEPHQFEQLGNSVNFLRPFESLIERQRPPDDFDDLHARIERGEGVLEDHLNIPSDLAHLGCGQGQNIFP